MPINNKSKDSSYVIYKLYHCSLMATVLEITWPESLSWIAFGSMTYFIYGISHSDIANNENNAIDRYTTSDRSSPRNKSSKEIRIESMVLSKRQKQRYANRSSEDISKRRVEGPNYSNNKNTKGIIKNYHPITESSQVLSSHDTTHNYSFSPPSNTEKNS